MGRHALNLYYTKEKGFYAGWPLDSDGQLICGFPAFISGLRFDDCTYFKSINNLGFWWGNSLDYAELIIDIEVPDDEVPDDEVPQSVCKYIAREIRNFKVNNPGDFEVRCVGNPNRGDYRNPIELPSFNEGVTYLAEVKHYFPNKDYDEILVWDNRGHPYSFKMMKVFKHSDCFDYIPHEDLPYRKNNYKMILPSVAYSPAGVSTVWQK